MKTLKTIVVLLSLLIPLALGHAQGTTDPKVDAAVCANYGTAFYETTSSRDRGLSFKDDLDIAAKAAQNRPNSGIPPLAFVYFYNQVATNVRFNPQYKRFGPEMNKLLAESQCARIGPQAFFDELEAFQKTLLKK
jgi:hypothetical protein